MAVVWKSHMHAQFWLIGVHYVETLDIADDKNLPSVISYFEKLFSVFNSDKDVLSDYMHRCRVRFSDISCKDQEKDLVQLLNQAQQLTWNLLPRQKGCKVNIWFSKRKVRLTSGIKWQNQLFPKKKRP